MVSNRVSSTRRGHPRPTNPDQSSTSGAWNNKLPFPRDKPILLVGEGDFSFALCLHTEYSCSSLTSTTWLSADELAAIHTPSGPNNAAALSVAGHTVLYGVDATTLGRSGLPHGAALRRSRFATIIFNFPHVGGKSTDEARQARGNRELLKGFFESAQRLLEPKGRIVVTLWTGPAYDAWDARGVARNSGLAVERSGKFDWAMWKGYRHVRNAGREIGIPGQGWSGERGAKMCIFQRAQDLVSTQGKQSQDGASSSESHSDLEASDEEADGIIDDEAERSDLGRFPSGEEWHGIDDAHCSTLAGN